MATIPIAPSFQIRPYRVDDEAEQSAVVKLINECYRSDACWTNEADIISGPRITPEGLRRDATTHHFFLFEYHHHNQRQIVACVKTGLVNSTAVGPLSTHAGYIGTLAVHPDFQSRRLASRLISHAEAFCREQGAKEMVRNKKRKVQTCILFYIRRSVPVSHQCYFSILAIPGIGRT